MPLILSLNGVSYASLNDNRSVKILPTIHWQKIFDQEGIGSIAYAFYHNVKLFKADLEDYLIQNMPFRLYGFQLYKKIKSQLNAQILPDKVVKAEEDWYFMGNSFSNVVLGSKGFINFSNIELELFEKEINSRLAYCDSLGIKYYLAIAPNKHTYYGNFLPIQQNNKLTRFQQILELNNKYPIINLGEHFINYKDSLVYHKYDSHWNSLGAYSAYQTLIQYLGNDFPNITNLQFDQLKCTKPKYIYKDLLKLLHDDKHIAQYHYTPKTPKSYQIDIVEKFDLPQNHWLAPKLYEMHFINESQENKILFFRDSYMDALMPFINESFGYTYYYWVRQFNKDLIEKYKPQIVIDQIVERNLPFYINTNPSH
jgi:hypothetical protein